MSILAVVLLWAQQFRTAEVRKIYVIGNNEAASSVRRKIAEAGDKYGEHACFSVVSKSALADGTMAVNQSETSGGINAFTAVLGSGSTTVVNSELSAKDGTVLWQDSKQGMPGIVSTGSAGGAKRVLESLYRYSGCDKKGRRQ